MELNNYKRIEEISTGDVPGSSPSSLRLVNEFLNQGWDLIAVHLRGDSYSKSSIYILGHTNKDAIPPQPKSVYLNR